MNIGLNASQYHHANSGIGQYIKSLCFYLIPLLANRDDVDRIFLYLTKDAPEPKFAKEVSKLEIVRLPVNRYPAYKRALYEQLSLPFRLWKDNIHVYYSPDSKIPMYFLKKIKILVVIHDMCVFRWPQEYKQSRVIFWKWAYKRAIKNADKVIAISDFTKKEIIEFIPGYENKICVVHNGIDYRFNPDQDTNVVESVVQRCNLPKKYLMFVGQFSPRKNLKSLLIAFSKIKDEYPDLDLLIVGMRGWKDEHDIKLVSQLEIQDRVKFPGYVNDEDLPIVYKLAQLSVYPSYYEGFGLPPLESIACGTICVAANTSSIPEVTGGHAVLVSPTVEGIAYGIKKVINLATEEKQQIIQDGIDFVKLYSWEKAAAEVYSIFDSIAVP